ncbi:dTDP-4-dehydrorhamnose 3,5-epimerase family protein [Geminicoccus flavidas]|uniref:dTDP-4-dehydrorhamnose 3,5-epimerase family protein n=1 Tax=Geminicoccus flavidas TaxID=2506407 RepID=UPI0013572D71|nr:dTDP-4-dehydrorhamnose 3,5-epimerase family protein [Geminicoccus flavidas]
MREVDRPLPGMRVFDLEPRQDERGSFTRLFCRATLAELGFEGGAAQSNLSRSVRAGTLRGLHYQLGDAAETKLVTVVAGTVCDVVLDLRPYSPSFGRHVALHLDAALPQAVLIPAGCAHGFLTTKDATTLLYFTSHPHAPVLERGVRWDDPAFRIAWPEDPVVLSQKDRALPDFDPRWHLAA